MTESNDGFKLRQLLEKSNLTLGVVAGDRNFVDIVVSLPVPDANEIPRRCPGCNKKAELDLYEHSIMTPYQGVKIRYTNNIGYKVRGCPIRKWDGKQYDQINRKLHGGWETPETKMLGLCLADLGPPLGLTSPISMLINNALEQANISFPTSVFKVKAALGITETEK